MQTSNSIARLTSLGLMNPLAAIETIIDGMQPADLIGLQSKVRELVDSKVSAIKRRVKRTRLKELEAWHLKCGDREIIAQSKRYVPQVWRVYEVKRTKSGELKKGRLLESRTAIDGLNDVVWDLAIGKY